jgi:hypothetical protein
MPLILWDLVPDDPVARRMRADARTILGVKERGSSESGCDGLRPATGGGCVGPYEGRERHLDKIGSGRLEVLSWDADRVTP